MPCQSYFEEDADLVQAKRERAQMKEEVDQVTRYLCATMRYIEQRMPAPAKSELFGQTPGLAEWWRHHQELDEQRITQEALAKLSIEERKLLEKHFLKNTPLVR